MRKKLAEETERTIKARKKLKKRLGVLDEKVTDQALEQKSDEIHRWISRHASNRVVLKEKSISLFDSGRNTAKMSSKLEKMAKEISKK